ncbi:MAG: CTP-dependent riboflavin kinase [Candidatus Aenigmarchaeota archaeon]|nr:CTP-dependent riboflavin kinase [Candidatus Aenigmarchaeota archaeon]
METLSLLIYLGKKGATKRFITVTTPKMGGDLGISQQSVSRWLISLERDGMIARKEGIRGYLIQITRKGMDYLYEVRSDLNEIILSSKKIEMRGQVTSGMLDAKYYMGLRGYRDNIKSKLGFKPFLGTLNVRLLSVDDTQRKEMLCGMDGIDIPGFRQGNRIFGGIKCFPCDISGTSGAVIIPERSHYGFDTIEVISPHNLRKRLKLHDGDGVNVRVTVD